MSNVEDILAYAWGKDTDRLKNAVDSVLSARASDIIADMTADVSASMFGNTSGEEALDNDEVPQQEPEYNEEPALEGSDNAE